MDPLSGVLAFTGLASSLITLAETVLRISKKLYELHRKFKNAPKKMLELNQDLQNLHTLIQAISTQFIGSEAIDYPTTLRAVCENFIMQLEKDLKELNTTVNKLNTESSYPFGKRLKVQAQQILAESTVNEFRGRISTHMGYLSLVQTLINNHKADSIRKNNLEILDETRSISRLVTSQMRLLKLISQRHPKHLALNCEQDAFEESRKEIIFSMELNGERKCYDFGFGFLSFQASKICSVNRYAPRQRRSKMQLRVCFVPPSWISCTALNVKIHSPTKLSFFSPWPKADLEPTTINQSSKLLIAIHKFDLIQLKHLFQTRQARTTDMVMNLEMMIPVTIWEALLHTFLKVLPCGSRLSKYRELLIFLMDLQISLLTETAIIFFISVNTWWFSNKPKTLSRSAHYYLRMLLDRNVISMESFSIRSRIFVLQGYYSYRHGSSEESKDESVLSTLVEGVLGFEGLKYYLFHQCQSWVLEELSGRNLWYVAVLWHVEQNFRATLRAYMGSFRSSLGHSFEALLKSVLSIDKIASQVAEADLFDRSMFIGTLASKGTPAMLKPFLEANINLDEGVIKYNYLGTAASEENLELFKMLLAAGASTARAIPKVCAKQTVESRELDKLFVDLIDNLTAREDQIQHCDFPDPLTAIINNDHALSIRPDAPQILLEKNIWLDSRLHGSQKVYPCNSYIFQAICHNRIEVLKLLLEYKPPMQLDIGIKDMFATDREHFQSIINCSWLTLAVELGRSDCVKAILAHAENQEQVVNQRDASGRTALQIAQLSVNEPHPRRSVLNELWFLSGEDCAFIHATEDNATLLILQSYTVMSTEEYVIEEEDTRRTVRYLLSTKLPYLSTILHQIDVLKASVINNISKLQYFPQRGFSYNSAVIGRHSSDRLQYRDGQNQGSLHSQLAQLNGMTFLEGFLIRLSYVTMLSIVIVCELTILIIAFRDPNKFPRRFWVATSLALLLVLLATRSWL